MRLAAQLRTEADAKEIRYRAAQTLERRLSTVET
jgi:hypothetical protein